MERSDYDRALDDVVEKLQTAANHGYSVFTVDELLYLVKVVRAEEYRYDE